MNLIDFQEDKSVFNVPIEDETAIKDALKQVEEGDIFSHGEIIEEIKKYLKP